MRQRLVAGLLLGTILGLGVQLCHGQSQTGTIETVGIGLPDPSISNKTQRQAMAREAALTDAQAKMLSILQAGPSGSAADPEKLKGGILKGAYVVKTRWAHDGICRLTLRMKKPTQD
jgi:hypothetical protein